MDSLNLKIVGEKVNYNAVIPIFDSAIPIAKTCTKTATSIVNARVFIEYNQQYLYLQKTPARGGKLSLPGGNIDKREGLRKGLVREIREEVNLNVKKKALQPIHTLHHQKKGVNEVVFFFALSVQDLTGLRLNEPDKFSQLVWIDKTLLPSNLTRPLKYALKRIKKGKLFSEYRPKKKKKPTPPFLTNFEDFNKLTHNSITPLDITKH